MNSITSLPDFGQHGLFFAPRGIRSVYCRCTKNRCLPSFVCLVFSSHPNFVGSNSERLIYRRQKREGVRGPQRRIDRIGRVADVTSCLLSCASWANRGGTVDEADSRRFSCCVPLSEFECDPHSDSGLDRHLDQRLPGALREIFGSCRRQALVPYPLQRRWEVEPNEEDLGQGRGW